MPDVHVLGTLALILVAGVDTTWSSIGSAMWHLATHDDDRRRLVAEPELIPTAIEELLRAYSPVTMARIVTEDTELAGCPIRAGDKVLLSFPAANRDPEAFERADEVVIDRGVNRHVAFGVGIHRCAGSNLARMELQVAVEQWLARIPEFRLDRRRRGDVGRRPGPRAAPRPRRVLSIRPRRPGESHGAANLGNQRPGGLRHRAGMHEHDRWLQRQAGPRRR